MRLEITTRNYTMRGNFKDILEKKIHKLDRMTFADLNISPTTTPKQRWCFPQTEKAVVWK